LPRGLMAVTSDYCGCPVSKAGMLSKVSLFELPDPILVSALAHFG
jgi:hypothetical protein